MAKSTVVIQDILEYFQGQLAGDSKQSNLTLSVKDYLKQVRIKLYNNCTLSK